MIDRWIKDSLLMKMLTAASKPEIYAGSVFCNLIARFIKYLSVAAAGSFFKLLSLDSHWEKSAVNRSRIIRPISCAVPLLKKGINHANRMIGGSLLLRTSLRAESLFMERPLPVLGCFLFFATLSSTALKALFSSFTLKALVFRLILLAVSFAMAFINVNLERLLRTSILAEAMCFMIDESDKVIFKAGSGIRGSAFDKTDRWLLAGVGTIIGSFYYFLPAITFIKLFGLIFLSVLIYIKPWCGLYLAVFMLPLAPTAYSVAVIGLVFASLLLNCDKFDMDMPAAIIPALMFMAVAAVSAVFSVMRSESLKTLPLYAAYFMAFYSSAILMRDRVILKTALFFQMMSALLLSAYGIYQYFFIKVPTAIAWVDVKQFPELATRVYATLENPNVLAEYLALAIPMALGMLFAGEKLGRKLLFSAITGVLAICLVLTFSRGAWLGLVLALLVFAAIKEPRLLIWLILLGFVSPLFMPSVVVNRIASIGSLEDSSNAFRVTIWIAAIRMIKDYWIAGAGLGLTAFSRVYRDYMIAGTPALHAHNLYLEMGIEMGVAGILTFIWMIIAGFSRAVNCIGKDTWHSFLLAAAVGALAGHLLHGMFDYVWFSPRIVMDFWLVFGMTSALAARREEALNEGAMA
ncbi:MAG: O-antigen ligase family protein [Tepidanaerobacteraceae bacterium]|jgi:O-antigen ligase|nr:O-antigen ligase family protein [Tepidanaerobacteraceae bacterium]